MELDSEKVLNRFLNYLTSLLEEKLRSISDEDFYQRMKILEEKIKDLSLDQEPNPKKAYESFKKIFYEVLGDIIKDSNFIEKAIIDFLSQFLNLPAEEISKKLEELLS